MATKAELEEQLAELEGECESLEKKLAKAEAALVKAKEKAKEKADEPKGPSFDQACSCPATLVLRAQKQSFGVKLVALSVKDRKALLHVEGNIGLLSRLASM